MIVIYAKVFVFYCDPTFFVSTTVQHGEGLRMFFVQETKNVYFF